MNEKKSIREQYNETQPVIPHLRVTTRGVFDADAFKDVPLFSEEP